MFSLQKELGDLVRYSTWASKRLLAFAATLPEAELAHAIPNSHGGILKTFQHIYYADRIWLARLEHVTPTQWEDPAPGPSLADLDQAWWPLLDRMAACSEAGDGDAQLPIHWYTGADYVLPKYKVVIHVVNHASYHRGQIAAMLRQCGHVPPSTDLVFYQLGLG
jgi:uncharacterized damage-inducible protein DinB